MQNPLLRRTQSHLIYIGVKLILLVVHKQISEAVPKIDTLWSKTVIVTNLLVATVASLIKSAKDPEVDHLVRYRHEVLGVQSGSFCTAGGPSGRVFMDFKCTAATPADQGRNGPCHAFFEGLNSKTL